MASRGGRRTATHSATWHDMPVLDTDTTVRFSSSKNDSAPAAQPQASHRGEADRLRHEAAMEAKIKAKELAKNEKAAAVARARRLGTFKRVAGTVAGLALLEGFTPPSDDEIRKEVAMRKAGLDALRAFCGYLGLNDAMKVKELMHRSGKNTDCTAWSVDPRFNITSTSQNEKDDEKFRSEKREKAKQRKLKALRKKHRNFGDVSIEEVQQKLRDVFRNYCSKMKFHETGKLLMDSVGCHKLVRDCKLLDNFFTYGDCDTCLSVALGKGGNTSSGNAERAVDFATFDVFLQKVADKKFPGAPTADDAWNALVKHYVLPFAGKHEATEKRDVLLADQCMLELRRHYKMLKSVFVHYTTLRQGGGETWEGVRAMGATLSPDEFYLFLLNFDVAPDLVRKKDVMELFYSGQVELETDPDSQKGEVAFPAFCDLIMLTGMAIGKFIPERIQEGNCSVTELNAARKYANCCETDLKKDLMDAISRNFHAIPIPYNQRQATFRHYYHTVQLRGHILDVITDNRNKRRLLADRRDDHARLTSRREHYLNLDTRSPRRGAGGASAPPSPLVARMRAPSTVPDGAEELEAAVRAYSIDSRQEKLAEMDLTEAYANEIREKHGAFALHSSAGSGFFDVIRKAAMRAEKEGGGSVSPDKSPRTPRPALPHVSASAPPTAGARSAGVRFDFLGSSVFKSGKGNTQSVGAATAHSGNRLTKLAAPSRAKMDGSKKEGQLRVGKEVDAEAHRFELKLKKAEQTGMSTASGGVVGLNKKLYMHHLGEFPDVVEVKKLAMGPVPPPWLGFRRLRDWVDTKGRSSKLSSLFAALDTDRSGTLSSSEFRMLLKDSSWFAETRITESLLLEMIKAADVNGDGTVDWQEFERAFYEYAPSKTGRRPDTKPKFPYNVPGGSGELSALTSMANNGDAAALRVSTKQDPWGGDLGKMPLERYIANDDVLGRPPPTRGGKQETTSKLATGVVFGREVKMPKMPGLTSNNSSPRKAKKKVVTLNVPSEEKISVVAKMPALDEFDAHVTRILNAQQRPASRVASRGLPGRRDGDSSLSELLARERKYLSSSGRASGGAAAAGGATPLKVLERLQV
ncbi:calmodulin [Pseudoscourfieldia marina]